ncbi:S-type pyocin domain-containing protein [Pseudomonas sp. CFBP 13711]|uniref:colicin E3/pyocin S6 family cytotoxin n=1 Tax=unclassified Pseudomonas TaxID=196821 RepID=UPI001785D45F|nr:MULTISPECIES: colicin E3/pyocin S6 family cytotoxin [unclassified Pseudomonas]MBD8707000.1 S-type pyocin domain-containing protein [Pseudomonas sp. CFBP 13711]MBD8712846.1 S-type pyocin domain-containing protein [Pseudomonas sp. CFBP 13715]
MFKDDKEDPFWANSIFEGTTLPNGGASWAAWNPPPEPVRVPTPMPERWPAPKERTDKVFAKSCTGEWCSTDAGTEVEPASNFGAIMMAGAMLLPSASNAIAAALGADMGLGRMAGGGIMQRSHTWLLRGAGGPASLFIVGMLPAKMGDGTLYTDDELRNLTQATTRVRFQLRRDAEGELQIYGIHSKASGDDSVRTVQARWNADKSAMEAHLNGVTILMTPRRGRYGTLEPLVYPENSDARLGTILVHPIPDDADSQLEGLPGDDITAEDCILVFPADSGLRSMYVVYARPFNGDHGYHPPPKELAAFPDAKVAPRKTSIKGGGGLRKRWKTQAGEIFEWDSQHGTVEKYNKRGKHLGEFDVETGTQTKSADSTREVEP